MARKAIAIDLDNPHFAAEDEQFVVRRRGPPFVPEQLFGVERTPDVPIGPLAADEREIRS